MIVFYAEKSQERVESVTFTPARLSRQYMWYLYLNYLWKLTYHIFIFFSKTTGPISTWFNSNPYLGEEKTSLWKWRITPLSKGKYDRNSKNTLTKFLKKHIFSSTTAAVTWLEYCRYGVKLYPINQSSTNEPIAGKLGRYKALLCNID